MKYVDSRKSLESLERKFECTNQLAVSRCGLIYSYPGCLTCVKRDIELEGLKNTVDSGCAKEQIEEFCSKPRDRIVPISKLCWNTLLSSPYDQCHRGEGATCSACVLGIHLVLRRRQVRARCRHRFCIITAEHTAGASTFPLELLPCAALLRS